MNEWENEKQTNEQINEWMNKQTNERTNERTNEWTNECNDEWMNVLFTWDVEFVGHMMFIDIHGDDIEPVAIGRLGDLVVNSKRTVAYWVVPWSYKQNSRVTQKQGQSFL